MSLILIKNLYYNNEFWGVLLNEFKLCLPPVLVYITDKLKFEKKKKERLIINIIYITKKFVLKESGKMDQTYKY